MESESIKRISDDLKIFLSGKEQIFSFSVDCSLEERIKVIYSIIFPGLKNIQFYKNFFLARIAQFIDYSPLKIFLYKLIGCRIGKGVFISPDVILDPHFPSLIQIDDYAILGWGAKLFTHEYSQNFYRVGRIVIGRGSIIGAYSTIRGGVKVGAMSEIPYGCIVIKDIAPNTTAKTFLKGMQLHGNNNLINSDSD